MILSHEEAYLESRVYTARPWELVYLLYEAALEAVLDAAEAQNAGQIVRRSRSVSKAQSCIIELAGSLNVEAGGEVGARMAVLYEYLLHQLTEANVHQSEAMLGDCERVLRSLMEGWKAVMQQMDAAEGAGTQATPENGEAASPDVAMEDAAPRMAADSGYDFPGLEPQDSLEDAELCGSGRGGWSG